MATQISTQWQRGRPRYWKVIGGSLKEARLEGAKARTFSKVMERSIDEGLFPKINLTTLVGPGPLRDQPGGLRNQITLELQTAPPRGPDDTGGVWKCYP